MIYVKPSFYNEFKCIAEKCTDNCCIGWEIDIDDTTLEKYNSMTTPFSEEIREKITVSEDGSNCFILCENGRCPFLNKNNLCDIIINCSEEAICDICTEHPRFYNCFTGIEETGLGLSCEEVCRLLLHSDFSLITRETKEIIKLTPEEEKEKLFYSKVSYLRSKVFDIMGGIGDYSEKIKNVIRYIEDETEEMCFLKSDKELFVDYKKSEPIDEEWTSYIGELSANLNDVLDFEKTVILSTAENDVYSKLFLYIIYRHMIRAVYDGEIMCRVCFAAESVRFIILSDLYTFMTNGEITEDDRINNIKRWSQQVEYSEENTDFLIFGV